MGLPSAQLFPQEAVDLSVCCQSHILFPFFLVLWLSAGLCYRVTGRTTIPIRAWGGRKRMRGLSLLEGIPQCHDL
jgi:hypothetical protein